MSEAAVSRDLLDASAETFFGNRKFVKELQTSLLIILYAFV